MAVRVTRTTASAGSSTTASGTSATRTSRTPPNTTARTAAQSPSGNSVTTVPVRWTSSFAALT